ncbi:dicarboxylate/amino acid:cation symporter [Streptococcus minor]|uniref:Dicarboxylate/amino acid:cation symporter n=1 Tax=Streptococcus minor TaxID=229549 RepID=A0A3P1VFJ2_9STRE|nr:dicarboxylate/amino acid:cation symporter [Streptococcus minor]RRD32467.1 dicarboxylate/amino acid:cation symporter [Streptococcus minor]
MDDKHFIRKILIAIALGVLAGFLFKDDIAVLDVVGKVFLRTMQMVIPLLVLGQVIQALGSLEKKDLSALGIRTIVIFGVSSLLAAYWGILFTLMMQPGKSVTIPQASLETVEEQSINLSETIISFFPQNIMDSLSRGSIIQIIIFAIFMGVAVNIYASQKKDNLFLPLLLEFNAIIMQIIRLVMKFAPLGIFSMIAVSVGNLGLDILLPMVQYLLVFGLATLTFLLLWVLVIALYSKKSFRSIVVGMKSTSLMALATTSSAVTLPLAMEDAHSKLGISKRVVDLVLPMGVSLNSNGSAMHMAITVVTIAQLYDIHLDGITLLYIGVLATFISLANAVVPGAGLVSLAIIVPQLGLPIESIALFAGVEWFVGMLRTITNVNSDVFSAVIVDKMSNIRPQ